MQLRLENVSYKYRGDKNYILKDISCKFHQGMNFLIGENGTGKTTLINLLNGIYEKEGYIYINEEEILENKNLKKEVAIVYQFSDSQFFNTTVLDEILYAVKKRKMDIEETNKNIKYYFKLFNLKEEMLEKNPFSLSGGEKKKISIISMLILNPKILILDEPTIGLDRKSRDNLLEVLKSLSKDIIVIVISHSIEEVYNYADYILKLKKDKTYINLNKFDYFKKEYEIDNKKLPYILKLKRKLKYKFEDDISEKKLIEELKEKYDLFKSVKR